LRPLPLAIDDGDLAVTDGISEAIAGCREGSPYPWRSAARVLP
jgi:hypothetical protein